MKKYQILIWLVALVLGVAAGMLKVSAIDAVMNVIAMIFTRLFRLIAVPTIVLAVVTTLASLGSSREMGRMFRTALSYTLLTTFCAAAVGLGLYLLISPDNVPAATLAGSGAAGHAPATATTSSYGDYLISVIPDNIVKPFVEGNVLGLMLLCFAVGIAVSRMPDSAAKTAVVNGFRGLQEVMFTLIRWLIAVLPIGIVAFAAQFVAEAGEASMLGSLGKYVAVIVGGNCLQFFLVLPLFLLLRGINPVKALRGMTPAVIMAFFTKSSAATLPVTIDNSEKRLGVSPEVARFVLPICTTINMNGCAAFILVTSLYVMQNNGMSITPLTMLLWLFIAVLAAVGNAGVPMGCYFLTLSLMSGIGADISLLGVILPVYTIIDMVETAENVWSDSCVGLLTDRSLRRSVAES